MRRYPFRRFLWGRRLVVVRRPLLGEGGTLVHLSLSSRKIASSAVTPFAVVPNSWGEDARTVGASVLVANHGEDGRLRSLCTNSHRASPRSTLPLPVVSPTHGGDSRIRPLVSACPLDLTSSSSTGWSPSSARGRRRCHCWLREEDATASSSLPPLQEEKAASATAALRRKDATPSPTPPSDPLPNARLSFMLVGSPEPPPNLPLIPPSGPD